MIPSYYVYAHLDEQGVIRYIGKGKGPRAYIFRGRKGHHKNWIKSLQDGYKVPTVEILEAALTEIEALRKERMWIAWLRPLGRLCNLTDGGEIGPTGMKHSAATRAEMARTRKGTVHSAHTRALLSKAHRGRTKPAWLRELWRASKANKACKRVDTGEIFSSKSELARHFEVNVSTVRAAIKRGGKVRGVLIVEL